MVGVLKYVNEASGKQTLGMEGRKRAFIILMSRNRCHLVDSIVVIVYFMQKKKKTRLTAISSSSRMLLCKHRRDFINATPFMW